MDVLHLALYVVASLVALRSLTSLMSSHRAHYAHRRVAELGLPGDHAASVPSAASAKMAPGKPAA